MFTLIPRKRLASDLLDSEPKLGSYNGVTSDGVAKAVGAIDELIPDDASSDNKLATQADVTAVEEQVEGLGKPLQWKGPATVSELNTGIPGIQPGWTYTLTDAGILNDGSVNVDVGDEVAWTEDDEWFKLGGDGGVKVFSYIYSGGAWQYPSVSDVNAAVLAGKVVYLREDDPGSGKTFYTLAYRGSGSGNITVRFVDPQQGKELVGYLPNGGSDSWTRKSMGCLNNVVCAEYDPTLTYTEGSPVMHEGLMYYCSLQGGIVTPEDWDSTHWTRTSATELIGSIKYAMFNGTVAVGPVYTFPDESEVRAAVDSGKTVIIKMSGTSGDTWYQSAWKYGNQYVFCETMRPELQLRLEYVGSAYQWSFFSEPVHNSVVTFTGTLDPDASPADYSGMPNTLNVADAISNGNEVRLELTNTNAGSNVSTIYRLIHNQQYAKVFAALDSIHMGAGGYVNLVVMTFAGSGNPWNWVVSKALQQALQTATKTESDISSGHMEIASNNCVTKLTLTTVNAVILHTSDYSLPPNFAVEIDNTGNSNDVTITVQHGPDSLKYSTAAGNTVGAGKYVQLTCVGNCWTLAEFTAPTP